MGSSCYPLSPQKGSEFEIEEKDQLRVILDGLGKCEEKDMVFISNEKCKKYFKTLNSDAPSKRLARLRDFLDLKDPTITELLGPML